MEFKKNIPIYLQISHKIKKDISLGTLKPGEKLMSTRDFSLELKVNPNTISRVYKELEAENIVFVRRGMGTFVVEEYDKIKEIKESMANEIILKFITEISDLNISIEDVIKILKKQKEE